jgi:hypothetical protein
MAITYTGDPSRVQTAANNTAACHGELETQLRSLAHHQEWLQAAVQSQHTGTAIYNALGNAWTQGKALSGTLQNITDALSQSGVNVDVQDLEGAAKLNAMHAMAPGAGDVGTWQGGAAKINTNGI